MNYCYSYYKCHLLDCWDQCRTGMLIHQKRNKLFLIMNMEPLMELKHLIHHKNNVIHHFLYHRHQHHLIIEINKINQSINLLVVMEIALKVYDHLLNFVKLLDIYLVHHEYFYHYNLIFQNKYYYYFHFEMHL